MVEWKKRAITGFTLAPIVFLMIHYRILITLAVQVATFLTWSEYRKLVQGIMKLHSSESEHNYINKLASSPKAIVLVHLMLLAADYLNSASLLNLVLMVTIAAMCLGRIFDFLSYLKIILKKDSTQKDPVLERKIFVLTFLQIGADTIGLCLFIFPLVFTQLMNNSPNRISLIIFWFVAAWQTDNGCLFLGALIGKTPFSPLVSPKKTWEGVSGGFFLSVFSCFVLSLFSDENSVYLPRWATKHYLICSLIVAFASILGDYLESFIKRAANVKDSGNLFPGHGGMLDRIDSLAITAPVVYFYSQFV